MKKILCLFLTAIICFSLISCAERCDTYTNGIVKYKLYKNGSYSIENIEKETIVEQGNYTINGEIITFKEEINSIDDADGDTQMCIYNDTMFFFEKNSSGAFSCERVSEGRYKTTEYDMFGSTTYAIMLNDDGTYGIAIIYNYGGDTKISSSGDYKLENGTITFTQKYEIDMDGNESFEEETFYGVIKDDTIYTHVYVKE